MKTHILYTKYKGDILYFNGQIIETEDPRYADIYWDWTYDIKDAIIFTCPDAWNLLSIARNYFENTVIEVKRIKNFEEILFNTC